MFPLLFAVCTNLAEAAKGNINGVALGYSIAVGDITADWPAWLFMTGLRYWMHNTHPCPKCDVKLRDMFSLDLSTTHSDPFNYFTHEEYKALVAASVKVRSLDKPKSAAAKGRLSMARRLRISATYKLMGPRTLFY